MTSRMINVALRALPKESRKHDGPAISSLAADMVDGGASKVSQARGIAGYGVKKRVLINLEWVRELPWRAALWMLALPIASVQAVMLLLSSRIVERLAVADLWPGVWTLAMFGAVAFTVVGAATRRRLVLLLGAAGLLALLIFDEYASGGGMVGGVSHTQDFSFPLLPDSVLSPVALILIPTTLLLIAAGSLRPPEPVSENHYKYVWMWGWMMFGFAMQLPIQRDLATPSIIYSSLGVVALLTGVIALTVFAVRRNRPEAGLAAGLLLGSQTLLFGCQILFAMPAVAGNLFGATVAALIALLAVTFGIPAAAAFLIVRYSAGPRRLR